MEQRAGGRGGALAAAERTGLHGGGGYYVAGPQRLHRSRRDRGKSPTSGPRTQYLSLFTFCSLFHTHVLIYRFVFGFPGKMRILSLCRFVCPHPGAARRDLGRACLRCCCRACAKKAEAVLQETGQLVRLRPGCVFVCPCCCFFQIWAEKGSFSLNSGVSCSFIFISCQFLSFSPKKNTTNPRKWGRNAMLVEISS